MMQPIRMLLAWVLGVLLPGKGKRRAGARPVSETSARCPYVPGSCAAVRGGVRRSPYGLCGLLDEASTALTRPYALASEGRGGTR